MEFVPHWPTCVHRSPDTGILCVGKRVKRYPYCLAHLDPDQLDQALRSLGPYATVEVPGTEIDAVLLDRILRAAERDGNPPVFSSVCFEHTRFTADANFVNTRFCGRASFLGAQFRRNASFEGAQFNAEALFSGACLKGESSFAGAAFDQGAEFSRTEFGRDARFDNAVFQGSASFVDARFGNGAKFDSAQFTRDAWFHGARFDAKPHYIYSDVSRGASFMGTRFHGEAGFDGVEFVGSASFNNAQFEDTARLGPLVAVHLTFQGSSFAGCAVIEAAAVRLDCRNATWKAGVTMSLRYAHVDLKGASFTVPSFITGVAHPFELTPGFRGLDEKEVQRRSSFDHPATPWMPFFTSLRGTDIGRLHFDQVDFSEYRRGIRLIAHLVWTGLKETVKGIGRLLWTIVKKIAGEAAKASFKPLFWTVVKFAPGAIASLLAWFSAGHHRAYAATLTVAAIGLIVTFLARRRIADMLSVPIRVQYVADSGWSASYGHARLTRGESRLLAISELAILRSRMRRIEKIVKKRSWNQPSRGHDIRRSEVQRRIQAWAQFPADASPRSAVLLDPPVLVSPLPDGTTSSSPPSAFLNPVRRFARELLGALRHRRKIRSTIGQSRRQLAGAEHALTMLFQQRFPTSPEDAEGPHSLLEWYRRQREWLGEAPSVVIFRRGVTSFVTDRGRRRLQAWQLQASGISKPIWVLDPDMSQQLWRPGTLGDEDLSWAGSVAQLDADGRTVVLRFSAAPEEKTTYPGAEVIETGGVVAVIPTPMNIEPATVKQPKQRWEVSAVLARPLGQRVLLDGNGSPVLVNGHVSTSVYTSRIRRMSQVARQPRRRMKLVADNPNNR